MLDPKPLWDWANERHAVYLRKRMRLTTDQHDPMYDPAGWLSRQGSITDLFDGVPVGEDTGDLILKQYRFCNVFRALDRVTVWVEENISKPYANHDHLWIMLAIARYINWPPTLQHLMETPGAWPSHPDFSPAKLGKALENLSRTGCKIYTGAYMIRAESNQNAEWFSWSKHRYIAEIVIGRLWEDRSAWAGLIDPVHDDLKMYDVWSAFQQQRYIGWGPFMAYQVVVDMRWTRYLRGAPDIQTWAAVGPGSRRGLNRLAGRKPETNISQDFGLQEMLEIHRTQDQYRAPWLPPVDLSDIQNCLCETDKYLRVKQGEGRPRSTYVPGRGY